MCTAAGTALSSCAHLCCKVLGRQGCQVIDQVSCKHAHQGMLGRSCYTISCCFLSRLTCKHLLRPPRACLLLAVGLKAGSSDSDWLPPSSRSSGSPLSSCGASSSRNTCSQSLSVTHCSACHGTQPVHMRHMPVFVSSLYCFPRQHSQVAWQVASGSQTHKLQGRRAHSAAGVVLVIAHEDVPLGLLVQLGGRTDGHRPQQAVQLLLGPQLRQEYVPGRVMLLDGWRQ